MASSKERSFSGVLLIWIGFAAVAGLCVVAGLRPPDGAERAELGQFIGRFHPLLVHGPIALILLAPILEIAGAFPRTRHLRAAVGFVLGLAAAASIAAAIDGWILARNGGYGGHTVVSHMWRGATYFMSASCHRACAGSPPTGQRSWRAFFACYSSSTFPLLVWTSHQGGALSHGDAFLTQHMPDGLRSLLGVAKPRPKPVAAAQSPASATFYAKRIAPLLDQKCVSCHGPQKVKGGLRLNSCAGLVKGGEDGM